MTYKNKLSGLKDREPALVFSISLKVKNHNKVQFLKWSGGPKNWTFHMPFLY